tara:strand:- start:197 stop:322 length:126 start_codon:yes stop_codon:yes gene_type:complete
MALTGKQKKLDANKNNKIDKGDFPLLKNKNKNKKKVKKKVK